MAVIKFETKGLEEHLERIVQMGIAIDEAVDRAMVPAAKILQAEMQAEVAVDTHNLQDHIDIDGPNRDGNSHSIEVGVIRKSGFSDEEITRYGNVQEYGSSSVAAHPFVRTSTKRKMAEVRKAIKQSLKDEGLI